MTYQRQIHDYLNGDLTPEQETELFAGIAQHDSWRKELTLQMKMQQSMQRDLGNIVIPAAVTAAVFAKIGIPPMHDLSNRLDQQTVAQRITDHSVSSTETSTGLLTRSMRSLRSVSRTILHPTTAFIAYAGATLAIAGIGYWSLNHVEPSSVTSHARAADHARASSSTTAVATHMSKANSQLAVSHEANGHDELYPGKPLAMNQTLPAQNPSVKPPLSGIHDGSHTSGTLPTNAANDRSSVLFDKPLSEQTTINSASDDRSSADVFSIPNRVAPLNDPNRVIRDAGKFASSVYLSNTRIIGVTDGGAIYISQDAGETWTTQQSNTRSDLAGVNFYDQLHGIVVGAGGTILTTSNAGSEWHVATSTISTSLASVVYATKDTAFACGVNGVVLRSTNGGRTWRKLSTGVSSNLFVLKFEDGMKGIVRGERGIILQTFDGGESWQRK